MTLKAERLVLRRFTIDDAPALFRNLYSDAEAMRFLPWDVHTSTHETKAHIADCIDGYANPAHYAWVIVTDDLSEPIGFIGAAIDETIHAARVSYGIGKPWWGKGYVPDALGAVLRFLFDDIGVNRVDATHDPRNPSSGKVMEKCGMAYEGTLRQARHRKGEYSDQAVYAVLTSDRKKGKK